MRAQYVPQKPKRAPTPNSKTISSPKKNNNSKTIFLRQLELKSFELEILSMWSLKNLI
jgi:hypothetical protein